MQFIKQNPFIAVGAAGLLTGLGGHYFFIIPVGVNKSSSSGNPITTDPTYLGWFNGPFSLIPPYGDDPPSLRNVELAASAMFNFSVQRSAQAWNIYDNGGMTPGPLGKQGGYIFLAVLLFGLYKKYY